jgi:hypothetical protein
LLVVPVVVDILVNPLALEVRVDQVVLVEL